MILHFTARCGINQTETAPGEGRFPVWQRALYHFIQIKSLHKMGGVSKNCPGRICVRDKAGVKLQGSVSLSTMMLSVP